MAKRLSARSVKSKQKQTLRYIASTDIERTARDYGVSTRTLRNFLTKDPSQVNQTTYKKFLTTDAREVAKERDVKLVSSLTGDRYKDILNREVKTDRQIRSIRYTRATRERYRHVDKEGQITYRPANQNRVKIDRDQILNNMQANNQKSIVQSYNDGLITRDEAKKMMRKLYANSGLSASRADAAFKKATD